MKQQFKELTATQFMAEKGVGLVTRCFTPVPEEVDDRVDQFSHFLEQVLSTRVAGKQFIKRVDVIVPSNHDYYPEVADCGLTAAAIKQRFKEKFVHVHELPHGDMFCAMQNHGVRLQRKNCEYHVFSSSEAYPYWEGEVGNGVSELMVEAACKGARATGPAVNPIEESIMQGRMANTLMMWHGPSLNDVGGFNLLAAKQMDKGRGARILYGRREDGQLLTAPAQGVEEMLPLGFMIEQYGQCLAPFSVPFEGLQYVPASTDEERLKKWNAAKFDTKTPRQVALLAAADMTTDLIASGVMDGYGWRTVATEVTFSHAS